MVDLLGEAREMTVIYSARYQQTLRRYHEIKIRGRILEVGDLMLRKPNRPRRNINSLHRGKDPTW